MKKIKTTPHVPTEFVVQSSSSDRAIIEIFPFEPSYAITLAHPIKRLIQSSTVGYAPTAMKIDGATHEFDSVRGVAEDVARLIVNLKNIKFKIEDPDEDRIEIEATFKGPKEITGADLASKGVSVSTPDAYFASVNEDGELKVSIIVEKGLGYVSSEELQESTPEGYLPLDAIFTSAKKVNYTIEKMLVEDNPNFEKIVFDVVSFGGTSPVEIFQSAVATMFKQMEVFTAELGIKNSAPVAKKSKEADESLKLLLTKVEDLNLSARSHGCLTRNNTNYLGEIVLMDESEISKIKNLGKKSLDEIKEKLDELGYPVGSELPESVANSLREKLQELKG